jgi:hypothetical protein
MSKLYTFNFPRFYSVLHYNFLRLHLLPVFDFVLMFPVLVLVLFLFMPFLLILLIAPPSLLLLLILLLFILLLLSLLFLTSERLAVTGFRHLGLDVMRNSFRTHKALNSGPQCSSLVTHIAVLYSGNQQRSN